jgi:hypothetical protein
VRPIHFRLIVYSLIVLFVFATSHAGAQSTFNSSSGSVEVKLGLEAGGAITDEWYLAIKDRIPKSDVDTIKATSKPLSDGERRWLDLIRRSAAGWSERRDMLHVPFAGIQLPEKIYILVGNQIGDDGFTFRNDTVCVDVGAMEKNYGDAGAEENRQRLIRLLDHEYTHLVHHEWIRRNPISLKTPLYRALRDLIVEGVGNYRSLSSKWIDPRGNLTKLAKDTLRELQPIFVDRLNRLSTADESVESELRKGLSRGPFNKKWGALTVALWLAQEAKGDDRKLARWIEKGPRGIIEMANRRLPKELKKKFDLRVRD